MDRTETIKRNLSTDSLNSLNKLRNRISKKECPICQTSFKNPVKTTCKASHEFCFSCIMQWVSTKGSLESCPLCRGGDKFIIINKEPVKKEYSYNSLNHFLMSKKMLQKVLCITENENTCLIPERILLTYARNKDQLALSLESRMSPDKLIKLINWDIPVSDDYCQLCSYTYRTRPRLTDALTNTSYLTRSINNLREINNEILIREDLGPIPGPPTERPHSPVPSPPPGSPPTERY